MIKSIEEFQEAATQMLLFLESMNAGSTILKIDSPNGERRFVYVCAEPERSEILVPLIEDAEKLYDEQENKPRSGSGLAPDAIPE